MGGKGGGGGGIEIPHGETLGNLFAAQMLGASADRMPWLRPALQHGGIAQSYSDLYGGAPLNQYGGGQATGPIASQAYNQLYGGRSSIGTAGGGVPPSKGQFKGAGALSPLPGTQTATPKFQAPSTPTYSLPQQPAYTPPVNAYAPQTSAIQPLKVPNQAYQIMGQQGVQQIGQASKQAQQDLMNQFASRGLGRSGLELQAAANLYNRGAGQQMSDLSQNLAAQRMQSEFGEAQQARSLEMQRQLAQAGLQQTAESQALQRALGLGQLGLSEQGLQQQGQNALMSILGGLEQSNIAGQAAALGQGGGKK